MIRWFSLVKNLEIFLTRFRLRRRTDDKGGDMSHPLIEIEFCGDSDRDMRHLRDAIHKLAHEVHNLIGVVHDLKESVSDLTDRVSSLEARVAVLEAEEAG